jgi:hypothetical protein
MAARQVCPAAPAEVGTLTPSAMINAAQIA